MKKILIIVISCLLCSSIMAQINHPLVEEGKVWYYEGSNPEAENCQAWEETYSLEGDTVIGSHQCLRLYLTCEGPYTHCDHSYIGAMYEESGKVYYIAPGNTTSAILYDFSCEVGDIVRMNLYERYYYPKIVKWDELELKINDNQLVKCRDKYLTVINWSPIDSFSGETIDVCPIWIESIGSPIDFLNSTPVWNTGCIYKELLTCKLNDQIIYDKNEFMEYMEYYPASEQRCFTTGTKWTEIRLDTLKYDNWYSKVGDEWVPNYETVEYSVKLRDFGFEGNFSDYVYAYNVYTNGPEWTDSLSFELYEFHTEDDICIKALSHYSLAQAYQFNWFVGKELYYQNIVPFISSAKYPYGTIEEIKEGDFGGVRPLKYVDLNGVRIIQGIGVTEWGDGECLFGPVNLYRYSSSQGTPPERHYRSMSCPAIQLAELDVSKCTKLEVLDCDWNQLASLDISKNAALKELSCGANQLSALDVSQNTVLNELHCFKNQLTELDVSNNIELTNLSCHENKLAALDLSKNTALEDVWCSKNQLTALDVSACAMLRNLRCYENDLTELDVSGCHVLADLICMSNRIKGEGMDALVESLPTVKGSHLGVINHINEQNVMTKSQVAAAKAKGWYVYYNNDKNQWKNYEGSDEDTNIASPLGKTVGCSLFDLQGRKVANPRKGIYIEDGRKVLIK